MKVKEIIIKPAFDKRNPDPKKNFGIHGCDLVFVYGDDEECVVQFVLFTNWHLPSVDIKLPKNEIEIDCFYKPIPADLGYHIKRRQYKGQTKSKCHLLKCGSCYYDGSGLNAQRIYDILLTEGSDGVWKELEQYYKELTNTK